MMSVCEYSINTSTEKIRKERFLFFYFFKNSLNKPETFILKSWSPSPWYNRTGWLGVKHQVIYFSSWKDEQLDFKHDAR